MGDYPVLDTILIDARLFVMNMTANQMTLRELLPLPR